jgi:UDP-N-acetylmuramoyl-tripeptide--D-alanyl-D-alanine ligase
LDALALAVSLVAAGLAGLRWLRVTQREHYVAGSATRFAIRWWIGFGPNRVLGAVAVLSTLLSPASPITALAGALAIAIGPFRMSLLGRSPGRLAWTRRLRTLGVVVAGLTLVPVGVAALVGAAVPVGVLAALLSPVLVDLGCVLVSPVEDRLARRFVDAARARLDNVAPVVVGITGSYGKTSTKFYVAHLCGSTRRVVATPSSFNNRAGLSRAINEHLAPGTDVFVAEMGTYGPGEIKDLCDWCPPRIAAITAIGPVHLERFGNEEAIVAAKAEIFGPAEVAVLNVDHPRLAALADAQEARGLRVWRCATGAPGADVSVRSVDGRLIVTHRGDIVAEVADQDAQPGNVAIAVAIALEVGTALDALAAGLASLPQVANRRAVTTLSTGATVIDDTFNSNPAGVRAALHALCRLATPAGKRVVVTPGMVELGRRQREENATFGSALASSATHVAVVGWTNRRALLEGLGRGGPSVMLVDTRDEAVSWVRANTGPGDVVLYENDLPDHYP